MSRFPRKRWEEMTTADFGALDRERVIAVLPVAAIEQHGPHLPVSVDAAINSGIIERVIALLPDDLPVTFLPMMAVGKSNEHVAFPGTLTFTAETLIRLGPKSGRVSHAAESASSYCSTATVDSRRLWILSRATCACG